MDGLDGRGGGLRDGLGCASRYMGVNGREGCEWERGWACGWARWDGARVVDGARGIASTSEAEVAAPAAAARRCADLGDRWLERRGRPFRNRIKRRENSRGGWVAHDHARDGEQHASDEDACIAEN